MSHQDGRCASDAETIYVQQSPACTTVADPSGGSAAAPFCGFDKAGVALSPTRRLFVVRGPVSGADWTVQGTGADPQVSIIGQQTAAIVGGVSPGLRVVGSDVYVRDLTIRRSDQIGISATGTAILRLSRVTVSDNGGGGVLIDASAFEIENALITGNGPGAIGPITWGGLLIQNPSASGPNRLVGVTVTNNNGPGISCTGQIAATGVLASGNAAADIGPACGFVSCGAPSATCGSM